MEYRKMLDRIALGVLLQNPDIPDFHLMVGTAEDLSSQPLLIPQHTIPKEVAKSLSNLNTLSNENIINAINDGVLEVNDFNGNTAVIGGMIGGTA